MNFGKWEVLFWVMPRSWGFNWGYWPNKRNAEFYFVNVAFIELRYFGAFNKKKVCKRCGQEMPANGGQDE